MNLTKLLVILIIFPCATFGRELKHNVTDFIKNAEMCEHFAGEWDSDLSDDQKKEMERQVNKYCKKAKRQRKDLLVKYKNSGKVKVIADSYDSVITYDDGDAN